MKKAVNITAINCDDQLEISYPFIKKYADQVKADLIIDKYPSLFKTIDDPKKQGVFEKFQVYRLFEEYDRVLQLDVDILINFPCPDLFQQVPYEQLGMYFEYKNCSKPKKGKRRSEIHKIQSLFGRIPGWRFNYANTGVKIISQPHKIVFYPPDLQTITQCQNLWFPEQTLINWRIQKNKIKTYRLSDSFNYMWPNCQDRFSKQFIHYAGGGNKGFYHRAEQMQQDMEVICK